MADPDDFARAVDRTVGAALRARRDELRLSQTDLAAALGVTHQQVAKYETGRDRIGAGSLAAAARVLGRDVAWFFDPANGIARLRRHCALLPLADLLPGFDGEDLTVRVSFTRDVEAAWPGLSIDTAALVASACGSVRAPALLPRAFYPAMLRHGEAALLAAADGAGAAPTLVAEAGPRAGAALN